LQSLKPKEKAGRRTLGQIAQDPLAAF